MNEEQQPLTPEDVIATVMNDNNEEQQLIVTLEDAIAHVKKEIADCEIKVGKTQDLLQSEETDENWDLVVTLAQTDLEENRICLLILTQSLKTRRLQELIFAKATRNFELRQEILDEMVSLDMIDENTYITQVNCNMRKKNRFDIVMGHLR